MARLCTIAAAVCTLLIFVSAVHEHAEAQPKPVNNNNPDSDFQEIMRLLKQPLSTEGFQEKKKLKDVLEVFMDRTQGRLPFIVNAPMFAAEADDLGFDPHETEVVLPQYPKRMPMRTALGLMLSQVSKNGVQTAYLVRPTHIEIVPATMLAAKHRLAERVMMRLADRPLDGALQDLAEETALTITLDPAVGKKAATPISVNFRNICLEDALVAVTEAAELKFVVLQDSIYVTTPNKAEAIAKEEKQRAERRAAAKPKTAPAK